MEKAKKSGDGRLPIAAAGVLYGTVTVGASLFSRNGLSALEISFFFLFLSIIPLGIIVAVKRQGFISRLLSCWKFMGAYALSNTFLVLSQFGSISLGLSPAITALLLYTQPVWTVVFGRLFFRERIDFAKIAVIILALAGVVLITGPTIPTAPQNGNLIFAELLSLSGGIFLSVWIILGKMGRLSIMKDPIELTLAVRGSTFIPIAVISFIALIFLPNLFLSHPSVVLSNMLWLVVFSVVAGILPDYLFYVGIDKVESLHAGVILLLEPVSAAIISAVLMISGLGPLQIVGGALILFSNYFATRTRSI